MHDTLAVPAISRLESAPLAPQEEQLLKDYEATLSQATLSYLVMGRCLGEVRDRKLYRGEYLTWEHYCSQRWDVGRSTAYNIVTAFEIAQGLHESGVPDALLPRNVDQCLSLAKLRVADGSHDRIAQAEVWRAVTERCGDRVTSEDVKAEVRRLVLEVADEKAATPSFPPPPEPPRSEETTSEVRPTEPSPMREDPEDYDPVAELRAQLPPEHHGVLDAQVRAWTLVESSLSEYRRVARAAKKEYDGEGYPTAGLAAELKGHLTLAGPENWRLCRSPNDGGCGGRGKTPAGACPRCGGIGFTMSVQRR